MTLSIGAACPDQGMTTALPQLRTHEKHTSHGSYWACSRASDDKQSHCHQVAGFASCGADLRSGAFPA